MPKNVVQLNLKRINHDNSCDETFECFECSGTNRICRVIDECYKFPKRISAILVADELGF